jgi:hypothetical protein
MAVYYTSPTYGQSLGSGVAAIFSPEGFAKRNDVDLMRP